MVKCIAGVPRWRWHDDVRVAGHWLGRVVNGWLSSYAVPGCGRFIGELVKCRDTLTLEETLRVPILEASNHVGGTLRGITLSVNGILTIDNEPPIAHWGTSCAVTPPMTASPATHGRWLGFTTMCKPWAQVAQG